MEKINIRFKELRKACKKNQIDFGKVLGISPSGVSDIESGRRKVTERHLIMLSNWSEYNININWLRTGNGEKFLQTETSTLEKLRLEYHLTDQQFNFISKFLRMSEKEKDVIFNFLSSLFDNEEGSVEDKIQEELDSYRKELELETRQTEKSLALNITNAKEA